MEVAKGSLGKNSENVRQNRNYNDENKVFVSCSFYAFFFFLALITGVVLMKIWLPAPY